MCSANVAQVLFCPAGISRSSSSLVLVLLRGILRDDVYVNPFMSACGGFVKFYDHTIDPSGLRSSGN